MVHGKATLELANALSVSNYSITKSVKRAEQHYEPFFPISFIENKIVTLGIKISEANPVALDFYLPRKFLDPLVNQYREIGEKIAFIKKDNEFPTLEGLGLFDNSQRTPTEVAKVLLIALQRWWLMEYAILDTAIISQLITTELIPLPAVLYAFAMANKEVTISRLSNLYQTFEEDIVDQVKGILSTTYEIPGRLKDEQVLIPITVSHRLLEIKSEYEVYTWLKQSGFIFPLEYEKTLVPLYQETIEEIINDVNKNSNLGLKPNISINGFVGEGKTGVLGQLVLKLIKEEKSIYIFQRGMVTGVFPSEAIFIIDNLHILDIESLKAIQRLQTHGYQIIFSQSKELTYTVATKFENLKLEINELPYLDKKPIIKIHVKDSRDLAAIDATVRNYFNQLFLTYDEFPKDLDIRKIVMTIIQDYLEGRLRPIRYLFPEEKEEAVYKTITEVINASGGEKATIGIFLYCLIAYFRLKYLTKEEKRKSSYSSPLIMDNPFAKASRLDLIHLQVGIANELNIQLIPFTHHQIIEAFHNYENLIPLKKFETTAKQVLELDKEFEYSIESGSVTVRPTIQLEQSELTSYIGE